MYAVLKFWFTVLVLVLISGCAKSPAIVADPEGNRAGSSRLMQIFAIVDGETLDDPERYAQMIHRSFDFVSPSWDGEKERNYLQKRIRDSNISDLKSAGGVLLIGIVYCCGGPYEFIDRMYAYAPLSMELKQYDTVEVKIGDEDANRLNTVTKVVHRFNVPPYNCRWTPNNTQLWNRIFYCDGMENEGWVEHKNWLSEYDHTWLKGSEAQ